MARNGAVPGDGLDSRRRRFTTAMLEASSVRDAATVAGVGLRTCWRYLREPAVRRVLAEHQDVILSDAARRLSGAMGEALEVLVATMRRTTASDAVKVSAARAVLECGLRLTELVSLSERVSELERVAERERERAR